MTSPRADRAQQLRAAIKQAITDAAVTDGSKVLVTSDSADLSKTSAQRYGAVLVRPYPVMEWPAPQITRLTWNIDVVGKAGNAPAMFARIDTLIEVIRKAFNVESADPEDIDVPDAPALPGYTLTLIDDYID